MNWDQFIESEMKKDYFASISKFMTKDSKEYDIYPPRKDIFNAFKLCPLDSIKLVLCAQDCYHSKEQAHGLAFSVKQGITIPPSLRNIYKEIYDDLGIKPADHGCLERWSKEERIFLLNSILTVRKGQPGSHSKIGWQTFTDNAIKLINGIDRPIVYLLFGSYAKSKKELITNKRHLIIEAGHPSPFSSHLFFGGRYFSRANNFLTQNGINSINWNVM